MMLEGQPNVLLDLGYILAVHGDIRKIAVSSRSNIVALDSPSIVCRFCMS